MSFLDLNLDNEFFTLLFSCTELPKRRYEDLHKPCKVQAK